MKDIITLWDTTKGIIPEGWHLCDGTDGSPLLNIDHTLIRAYRDTPNQIIPTGSITKIQFNAKQYDILSEFDAISLYRFTPLRSGYYFISLQLRWATPVISKEYYLYVYKNTAQWSFNYYYTPTAGTFIMLYCDLVYLAVGDYMEFAVYHNAGIDQEIYAGPERTFVGIHRLVVSDPPNSDLKFMIKV